MMQRPSRHGRGRSDSSSATGERAMRVPKVVAHRGYRARFPENTIAAVTAAIESGAEFFEVDIQLTADHEPVLFHDCSLDRVCGVPGDITRITAADLRGLRAVEPGRFGRTRPADEPIATLADLVGLLGSQPQVQAFLEVKQESVAAFGLERVLEQVLARIEPVRAQCVLISFLSEFLALVRERTDLRIGAVLREWEEREEALLRRIRPEFYFCDIRGIPDHGRLFVEGARIVIYEVVAGDEAIALAQRGVDLVETFDIGDLIQQMSSPQRPRRRPRERAEYDT